MPSPIMPDDRAAIAVVVMLFAPKLFKLMVAAPVLWLVNLMLTLMPAVYANGTGSSVAVYVFAAVEDAA